MKRVALLLLAPLYLLSALGFTVSSFYCCGEFQYAKVSVNAVKEESSSVLERNCGMSGKKKPGCCERKSQSLKVKDQHLLSAFHTAFDAGAVALLQEQSPFLLVNVPIALRPVPFYSNAPPDGPSLPVYVLNCTYRI